MRSPGASRQVTSWSTAREARRSAVRATILVGVFFLLTFVLGSDAAALVGVDTILPAPGMANSAAPLLALHVGSGILMAMISRVAFTTILAVVAGLTITASASFAHDFYNSVIKSAKANPAQEVNVARITAVVIGVLAIIGGIAANGQNIAFLVSLAFGPDDAGQEAVQHPRFSLAIYTGPGSAVLLIIFSPAVITGPLAIFPLTNPTIVSLPLAFLAGWLGTITVKTPAGPMLQAEMDDRRGRRGRDRALSEGG